MFLDPDLKPWKTKIQTLKVRQEEQGILDEKVMEVLRRDSAEKPGTAAAV